MISMVPVALSETQSPGEVMIVNSYRVEGATGDAASGMAKPLI